MCNAANKLILCAAIAATLASCSSNNANRDAAAQLVADAQSAIDRKQYDEAIVILDTLQARYPKEIEIQREAMSVRPLAIEGQTIRQLEQTDSLYALASWQVDSLYPLFVRVNAADLVEPYDVIMLNATSDNLFSTNRIEARLTPAGEFYMISSLNGNPVKHTSVSLSSNGATARTEEVPYDDAINYRTGNSEMITFSAARCDTLGRFAVAHDNSKLTLTFHGKRDYKTTLSAATVHAIADTYRMADATARKNSLAKQKELLQAKLQLARDQRARTTDESGNSAK